MKSKEQLWHEECYKEIREAFETIDVLVGAKINRLYNEGRKDRYEDAQRIEAAWRLIKRKCGTEYISPDPNS